MKKKGSAVVAALIVAAAVILSVFAGVMVNKYSADGKTLSIGGGDEGDKDLGFTIQSLTVNQENAYTGVAEGSDDLEFWAKGADTKNVLLAAKEVLDLSSGTVSDTGVANLKSGMTDEDLDLYIEGTGNYYDEFVSDWSFGCNANTGFCTMSPTVKATDVGTQVDLDNANAVDTGFVESDTSNGVINYTIQVGDGTAYIDFNLGNDEADSELRDYVICYEDADDDMEGDEFTALAVTKVSGSDIGTVPSNQLTALSEALGGSQSCVEVGDVKGLLTGTYRFAFTITEANWGASEEFELCVDDLGAIGARDYPSRNVKAASECVTIQRIA